MKCIERNHRLELLKKQKHLHEGHCDPCSKVRDKGISACSKCPIRTDLNDIGKQLVLNRKMSKTEMIAKEILKESETPYGLVLTRERLQKLEKAGFHTYQIEEMYGLSKKELYNWKKHQGLIKPKPRKGKEQRVVCSS